MTDLKHIYWCLYFAYDNLNVNILHMQILMFTVLIPTRCVAMRIPMHRSLKIIEQEIKFVQNVAWSSEIGYFYFLFQFISIMRVFKILYN